MLRVWPVPGSLLDGSREPGAKGLGASGPIGDEIRSLKVDKRADFVLIDLRRPTMLPVYTEPMRNIVR